MNRQGDNHSFQGGERGALAAGPPRVATALDAAKEVAPVGGAPVPAAGRSEPHMVGDSPAMAKVFQTIRRFAASDAPVLITGETGTGKELAALAVHERSRYRQGPFIPINCGGLPPNLIAAELFGHEKGAFTGAHQRRIGRIESAAGGTVFLDEIGDMPLELQPHLLRFLQEKAVERVGGNKRIPVDVRVIAATNAELAGCVQEKKFRADLFYRLDVLTLHMPPLRERDGDVLLLATFFLRRFMPEIGRQIGGFSPDAMEALARYSWPGNVRELISSIRRAVVMATGEWITASDLALNDAGAGRVAEPAPPPPGSRTAQAGNGLSKLRLDDARRELEEVLIRGSLERNRRNVSRAARELGVSRITMYRLMEKHRIATDRFGD